MPSRQHDISREAIFTVLAGDADGYYKLVLTLASAFLGGSLLFLEKVVPDPRLPSLIFMSLGWLSLVGSVAVVTSIRERNLRSGYLTLQGKVEEARKLDALKDHQMRWASGLLIAGMTCIMLAGAVGIWTKFKEAHMADAKKPDSSGVKTTVHLGPNEQQRNIPYASTVAPQQPTTSTAAGDSGTAQGGSAGSDGDAGGQGGGQQ